MGEILGVVVCTIRVVKMKEHLPFVKNSGYFVFKIDLLITVLSNLERKAAIKDSAFRWVACLTHKDL